MKVLHTISGMGKKCGGTSSCTYELLKGLQAHEIEVEVLSFEPDKDDCLMGSDVIIHTVARPDRPFSYSKAYKRFLCETSYQLYHTNGLWQYPAYITSKVAQRRKSPYIISPHGMLYPQALKKSALQKWLMLALSLKRDLNRAATIHATCAEEMRHLRSLGVKSPVAVIPNPVYISETITCPAPDRLRIGYLGRVHPRKNIERLIYAWAKLGQEVNDCELVIIGAGDDAYHQFLRNESNRLHLKNVIFTGFLSGEAKEDALKSLSYLVVPSDFENFGMIIPEALIKGIPVIASKGTPWEELGTHHCGWWVDNGVDTLTATIEEAIRTPEDKRREMGQNGQKLVKENYSVEVVAKKMVRLYKWILTGGEKPEFVYV